MGDWQLWGGDVLITPGGDIAIHEDCCCEGDTKCCPHCSGTIPETLNLTVSGWPDNSSATWDCDSHECLDLNGDFELTYCPDGCAHTSCTSCDDSPNNHCCWVYEFPDPVCDNYQPGRTVTAYLARLWPDPSTPGTATLHIEIFDNSSPKVIIKSVVLATAISLPMDCTTINESGTLLGTFEPCYDSNYRDFTLTS